MEKLETGSTEGGVDTTGAASGLEGSAAANGSVSSTGTVPSVIDLAEDALIRVKGSDKPVKFGEHVRGFQSQWTKAAQEAKRLANEVRTRDERIRQYEAERAAWQQRQQNPNGQVDPMAELAARPYLTGKEAAEVVRSMGEQLQQRDQILMGTLKQLQKMQQLVGGLHETHSSSAFDAKIGKLLADNGYSADYTDVAKEIYLAYEGDDLDTEFPNIFNGRVAQLRKAFEAERQAKIRAAKPQPFLPGRGGDGRPSKPFEMKPNASPKEVADELWKTFGTSET